MIQLLVDHDHPECIGCGACAAILPEFWEMIEDKAHLKESHLVGEHEHLEVKSEENFAKNLEAAEACPVNCIHLLKDDEKVI